MKGGRIAGTSVASTIATRTTIRTAITSQAIRIPSEKVEASCGSSRLCFAKVSVTAVEETTPPNRPVTAVPRSGPSQRTAM